jgi:hypothetical protein
MGLAESMKTLLHGNNIADTLTLKGNLTIGAGRSTKGYCPTPIFEGENCFLPPREQPYTVTEVALHAPSYTCSSKSYGPQCKLHATRHMARVGPCLYACTVSGEVFSLKDLLSVGAA